MRGAQSILLGLVGGCLLTSPTVPEWQKWAALAALAFGWLLLWLDSDWGPTL